MSTEELSKTSRKKRKKHRKKKEEKYEESGFCHNHRWCLLSVLTTCVIGVLLVAVFAAGYGMCSCVSKHACASSLHLHMNVSIQREFITLFALTTLKCVPVAFYKQRK